MYNNLVNTPAQDLVNSEFSSLRAANEWDVGKPKNLFKYIDYKKVLFRQLQPIGLYFRVCCVMTNALNILDEGQSAEFFQCAPPTLDSYFV